MKRLFLFIVLLTSPVYAQQLAFPTAEGYGRFASGGRAGNSTVYLVTNTNDSGSGTLRAALSASGCRTIIFRVSGTIQFTNGIIHPPSCLTIAGQTSPGGVQLRSANDTVTYGSVQIASSNIIVRHLRVRPGAVGIRDDDEGFIIYAPAGNASGFIFDHMSFQWGHDSVFMFYGAPTTATVQWSIIAEGADDDTNHGNAGGRKGPHFGGDPSNLSFHHNLLVNNQTRNPLAQSITNLDFRNNVVYGWGADNGGQFGATCVDGVGKTATGNIVNNIWKPNNTIAANNSESGSHAIRIEGRSGGGSTSLYISGNYTKDYPTGTGGNDWLDVWQTDTFNDGSGAAGSCACFLGTGSCNQPNGALPGSGSVWDHGTEYSLSTVSTTATASLFSLMTGSTIGAYKPSRDDADTNSINDAINGTGHNLIGDGGLNDGGTYPDLAGGAPCTYPNGTTSPPQWQCLPDGDSDGMPDKWESDCQLDPNSSADGNSIASNGYSNLENYLNYLAGDTITGYPCAGGGGGSTPSSGIEFNNQSDPATFVSLGGTQGGPPPPDPPPPSGNGQTTQKLLIFSRKVTR